MTNLKKKVQIIKILMKMAVIVKIEINKNQKLLFKVFDKFDNLLIQNLELSLQATKFFGLTRDLRN